MNNTNLGKKLVIQLDGSSGVPFYRQIIQQIEQAILAKRLLPGDKLPTIRSLAIELKINPNTIAKAYNELEIRGIVVTQVGSGTYVSDQEIDMAENERQEKIEQSVVRFLREMEALGVKRSDIPKLIEAFKEET
ncbi:MAG: GntR family transcriptional regulator [Spirochaetes bacterium]|nr:GntR family transcriptional regulator [Spirochaetota bacterium]